MKIRALAIAIFLLLGSAVSAEKPPPPVFNEKTIPFGLAQKAMKDYEIVGGYERDLEMVCEYEGKRELTLVHLHYLSPKYLVECTVLDPETRAVQYKVAESFDEFHSLYEETKTSRRMSTWARGILPECPIDGNGPQLPETMFGLQEAEVAQGGYVGCTTFNYYAGDGSITGVPDTEAFVSLSETGNWTAIFFDKGITYPKEIWQGNNKVAGKVRTIFSDQKQDEKGRWYATKCVDELRLPGESAVYKTFTMRVLKSSRAISGGFNYVPPPGTIVTQNGEKKYIQE